MTPTPAQIAGASACALHADRIMEAAHRFKTILAQGRALDAPILRATMTPIFDGSDADGAWDWKSAYEAAEIACVLFVRQYGAAMAARTRTPAVMLAMLEKIAALLPTHTKRSAQSQKLQQFSTPLPLAFVMAHAAGIRAGEIVLEPSAGTGMLAGFAERAGASLALNEFADARAALLGGLFSGSVPTRFDAAHIDDFLDAAVTPDIVLMNPPFSVSAHVDTRVADAGMRHIRSAIARLKPGGRCVALIGANVSPDAPAWAGAFAAIQENARLVFHAGVDGALYAKHGTHMQTRLLVFDKSPAEDASAFPASAGLAKDCATLLEWVQSIPARITACVSGEAATSHAPELAYVLAPPAKDATQMSEGIYEPYCLSAIRIPSASPHPTTLVQSTAMASVLAPRPAYRPHLPSSLVRDGVLSDAQLESVIYAGEAHAQMLAGAWNVDATYDVVSPAPEDCETSVRFRRGWFLGDGTGAGKGRQVAGVLLDNWLKGRRRALWISKSDKLLEDAQRDWSALGQERLQVTPLSRFAQGAEIRLGDAILFTTYSTLRSDTRGAKCSRVQQIVDWLGRDFDGMIVFDESHAMANAAGSKGARGDCDASQQGRAGLRLQHALPNARILYVSATGATAVHNLAYAQRLGLWGGADFPFASRSEFVEAVEAGGVAAMEVVARDLKALGLYAARSLSYEGVHYELTEHALSEAQVRIYDAYADAFQIIHSNLDAALRATGVKSENGVVNGQALSAARSAFESAKQRFFNHLLIGMKTPTLLRSIEADLKAGHCAVVQIVSTGEALMARRLAEIRSEDWGDVQVDITPREYVLDYLMHSFPVELHEQFSDGEGGVSTRPILHEGRPVLCREAVARRDRLIEHLASLAPVPGALDQLVQHFGADAVAEVTGRTRRIVRRGSRFAVEARPAAANLAETAAFMEDRKRILVFSDAGGTGRSYHAELSALNQRLRVHYLLEPGWRADAAIQGLGRTNRTNQRQPPLFRPIATDVKAEKRFLSTIARRLDTLGAITRGERQTGGQGLFRPEDNLESGYARDALRQLYKRIAAGALAGCTLAQFETMTGLTLTDDNGLKDELPPITTFLNRLLALRVSMQNTIFAAFEDLIEARIEGAKVAGLYEIGLERLHAESFRITDRRTIYTHPGSGAQTSLLTIAQKRRNTPMSAEDALAYAAERGGKWMCNSRSGRAALLTRGRSVMLESGDIEKRMRLTRPMEETSLSEAQLGDTAWVECTRARFVEAWLTECADIPPYAESTIYMVSGLILPIWKRLPEGSARVYRLQTDDGERVIGRRVQASWAAATGAPASDLSGDAAHALVLGGGSITLGDGLELRRSRIMGVQRIELCGFTDAMRDRLSAYGCFHEIISWKLRMFVPADESGHGVLKRLIERFPIVAIDEGGAS